MTIVTVAWKYIKAYGLTSKRPLFLFHYHSKNKVNCRPITCNTAMIVLATIQCSIHILFYFIVVWVTLDPWDLRLNTLSKGSLGHATYHIPSIRAKWLWRRSFCIFLYFYGSNLGPPGWGPSWTWGPSIEQTWYKTTRQCFILNFKHLSLWAKWLWRRKFLNIFLCISMVRT